MKQEEEAPRTRPLFQRSRAHADTVEISPGHSTHLTMGGRILVARIAAYKGLQNSLRQGGEKRRGEKLLLLLMMMMAWARC